MDQLAPRTRLGQLVQQANLSMADFVARFPPVGVDCGEGRP